MLQNAGAKVFFYEEVPYILNRTQTGQCPIDSRLNDMQTAEECNEALIAFYQEVDNNQ